MYADSESWRASRKDSSWLMFKENTDFNNLKIATLTRVILFISKGLSGNFFYLEFVKELEQEERNYF